MKNIQTSSAVPVTFIEGCVIEKDYIYVAARPDNLHREDRFARIYVFDDQKNQDKWLHHDLPDWRVVSVCVRKATDTTPRMACALSENGDVEYTFVGGELVEKIPDAGLLGLGAVGYGYVSAIREIGEHLYVCGLSGQVYRREKNTWIHFDQGLLQPMEPAEKAVEQLKLGNKALLNELMEKTLLLNDINGLNEKDIYTVGDAGRIFHHDGKSWSQVNSSVDENLIRIKCVSDKEVWICGYNGALLTGNWLDGFKDVSSVDDNDIFLSVEKFDGVVYVATERGLFKYDQKNITSVKTGLIPEIQDAHVLEVKDSVLWSFGFKDLAYFDGVSWTRMSHPDNATL